MIRRVYLKSLLSFESADIEFGNGLVVLSGPSGAGKSIFMDSILSSFGVANVEAKLCEVSLDKPASLKSDAYELDDELIVRSIKKERTRYFLNDQNISKKALSSLFAPFLNYLSVRDSSGFESELLLDMLDSSLKSNDKSYRKMLKEYKKRYKNYKEKLSELEAIRQREKKLSELIEFASFEINKIKSIDPKIGEDEELLVLKKQLSKIDKINDALGKAESVFALETSVIDVFALIGRDGSYFSDTMNQLRADFEETQLLAQELEDTDVEALLDRLEKIAELKSRYGSIEEAIEYRKSKEEELAGLERAEEDKGMLESFLELEFVELSAIASRITQARIEQAGALSEKMNPYLGRLKLPDASFHFGITQMCDSGMDSVELQIRSSSVATLSGGEHNRLRLALMVASLESQSKATGIIVLDEIDANVSGDESIAIADMIAKLSRHYQIFAISHQPHLAAKADQHILIDKHDGISSAIVLGTKGRVTEIARIIGGEMPGDEALAFAKKLLS